MNKRDEHMTKEVLKLALEALEEAHYKVEHKQDAAKREQAITAIKDAAQPVQEPVKLHEAVISAWSLREVYFDEDGEPSMHRSPPAAQPEQEPVGDVRGLLAARLTCWHRLTGAESDALVALFQTLPVQPVQGTVGNEFFEAFAAKQPKQDQRPWVGLTDEEVQDSYNTDYQAQTRAVEAKLKEKNT
jgi:hypothetical protein